MLFSVASIKISLLAAKWKFILSPVIFSTTTKDNDAWGAYRNERQLILDFIHSNNITGVIVLSGDLHMGGIDDGTNSGLPELVAPAANDGLPDEQPELGPNLGDAVEASAAQVS